MIKMIITITLRIAITTMYDNSNDVNSTNISDKYTVTTITTTATMPILILM